MIRMAITVTAFAGAIASPVAAEELKQVPAALDPTKAYVVVELGSLDDTGVKGEVSFARYDAAAHDVFGHGRSDQGLDKKAARGVRESARKGMTKDDDSKSRLHLLELEPSLYVIESANGTSFSLGSRTFRAAAGQVIDLGVFGIATDWDEGERAKKIGAKDVLKMALFGAFAGMPKQEPRAVFVQAHPRTGADIALPAELATRAQLVAWEDERAPFGNHLGGLVNRFGGRAERVPRSAEGAAPRIAAGDLRPIE